MQIEIWQFILIIVGVIIISAIATFFVTRKLFQKQLEKNPPINEQMIRAMFAQMGRTPSEKQVRAVMNSMKQNK
ncbi:MAG: YneF family protein [Acholeplasmatales bacterium]|nr:YneF family protein [Acholeplasmatales bacterium]